MTVSSQFPQDEAFYGRLVMELRTARASQYLLDSLSCDVLKFSQLLGWYIAQGPVVFKQYICGMNYDLGRNEFEISTQRCYQ
jgi:hypothetical protein